MANTTPTQISFLRAFWLCMLLLFSPTKFKKAQDKDNQLLNAGDSIEQADKRHINVRNAFASSFLLVLLSGGLGYVFAYIFSSLEYYSNTRAIGWLQLVGACLLLWGTLFVRGWEVQTIGGISLTERVNHWLYRGLYCLGTAVIVFSLSWPASPLSG